MLSNIDKTNSKALKKLMNNREYQQNKMQINCITKVLVEHADVPQKLIDWLIQSVQDNVVIEYKLLNCKGENIQKVH